MRKNIKRIRQWKVKVECESLNIESVKWIGSSSESWSENIDSTELTIDLRKQWEEEEFSISCWTKVLMFVKKLSRFCFVYCGTIKQVVSNRSLFPSLRKFLFEFSSWDLRAVSFADLSTPEGTILRLSRDLFTRAAVLSLWAPLQHCGIEKSNIR